AVAIGRTLLIGTLSHGPGLHGRSFENHYGITSSLGRNWPVRCLNGDVDRHFSTFGQDNARLAAARNGAPSRDDRRRERSTFWTDAPDHDAGNDGRALACARVRHLICRERGSDGDGTPLGLANSEGIAENAMSAQGRDLRGEFSVPDGWF